MAINKNRKVPKRIAQTILNSLKGGVVPRIGLPYITVGRKAEVEALLHDVELIKDGGASFRFIVGRYGSGKSFLLQTIRNYVMDKNFVVVDGDLSPERRLQGGKGQGLATYRELIQNLSTKTRPEGGALTLILDRWINSVQMQVRTETGLNDDTPAFEDAVNKKIYAVISNLSECTGLILQSYLKCTIKPISMMMKKQKPKLLSGLEVNMPIKHRLRKN